MISVNCTGQVYDNVKFVHNCSGSILVMLVATSRSDKYTNFRPASCHAHRKLLLLSKVTLGINNFSVVWIESLSNFKHFHISAMSNNRITADYEFFVNWQLSLQLVRAVGDLLTGVTIYRARVKHIEMDGNWTYRHRLPLPAILWNYRQRL